MSERQNGGEAELLALLRVDYDATQKALAGFVTAGGQLRAVGIAAWGVVFAAALNKASWSTALTAGALALLFYGADAYYSALYRQALSRATAIEKLLGDYFKAVGIHADTEERRVRATTALEQHRFGFHRSLKPVEFDRAFWAVRPKLVAYLYGVLVIAAVVLSVVLGARDGEESAERCTATTRGVIVCSDQSAFDKRSAAPRPSPSKPITVQTTPQTPKPPRTP